MPRTTGRTMKLCTECGTLFPHGSRAKTCSAECARTRQRRRTAERKRIDRLLYMPVAPDGSPRCTVCRAPVPVALHGRQAQTCSDGCAVERQRRLAEQAEFARRAPDEARQVTLPGEGPAQVCAVCGEEITGARRKFCSERCRRDSERVRAARNRRRAATGLHDHGPVGREPVATLTGCAECGYELDFRWTVRPADGRAATAAGMLAAAMEEVLRDLARVPRRTPLRAVPDDGTTPAADPPAAVVPSVDW